MGLDVPTQRGSRTDVSDESGSRAASIKHMAPRPLALSLNQRVEGDRRRPPERSSAVAGSTRIPRPARAQAFCEARRRASSEARGILRRIAGDRRLSARRAAEAGVAPGRRRLRKPRTVLKNRINRMVQLVIAFLGESSPRRGPINETPSAPVSGRRRGSFHLGGRGLGQLQDVGQAIAGRPRAELDRLDLR